MGARAGAGAIATVAIWCDLAVVGREDGAEESEPHAMLRES